MEIGKIRDHGNGEVKKVEGGRWAWNWDMETGEMGKHGNGERGEGGCGTGGIEKGCMEIEGGRGAWKREGVQAAAGWEAAPLQGRYLNEVAIQRAARGGDLVGLLSAEPKALL